MFVLLAAAQNVTIISNVYLKGHFCANNNTQNIIFFNL